MKKKKTLKQLNKLYEAENKQWGYFASPKEFFNHFEKMEELRKKIIKLKGQK